MSEKFLIREPFKTGRNNTFNFYEMTHSAHGGPPFTGPLT